MSSGKNCLYEFGDFVLDEHRRVLLRGGQPVSLTPKVFETLLLLVKERDHPIPHEELIKRIWPDTTAGKNNLDQNLFLLRKVLQLKTLSYKVLCNIMAIIRPICVEDVRSFSWR
jgi:DNA-binding winged helix-turn-helix (wHTH) protein